MNTDLDPEFLRSDSSLSKSARITAMNLGLVGPKRRPWHAAGLIRLLGKLKERNPAIPMGEIARAVIPVFVEQTGRDEKEVFEHAEWLESRPEESEITSRRRRFCRCSGIQFDQEIFDHWLTKAPEKDRILSRLRPRPDDFPSSAFLAGYFVRNEQAATIARLGPDRHYLVWPKDADRIDRISPRCSTTFHIQPIRGEWRLNPRYKHNTLFAAEDTTCFRHTLVESDLPEFTGEEGTAKWLRAMSIACKWPVKAIITTGSEGPWGLHFHLLTPPTSDAGTFGLTQRDIILALVPIGADINAITVVREARLPGRIRPPSPGKASGPQKILHFDPNPVKPFNQLFA